MPKVTEKINNDSKEGQTLPQSEVQKLQQVVLEQNEEKKASEQELEKTQRELRELKSLIAAKSETKREDETHSAASQRRLKMHPTDDVKNTLKTWNAIVEDAKPFIPTGILESIGNMRGKAWPHGTRSICADYQIDNCPQNFLHYNKKDKINVSHVCVTCVKIFDVGMAHPAMFCPTLQILDKTIEEQKMQIQN